MGDAPESGTESVETDSGTENAEVEAAVKAAEVGGDAKKSAESIEEWQAEAGKWKELASKYEQDAKRGLNAIEKLAEIEAAEASKSTKVAERIAKADRLAEEAAAQAESKAAETVEEWQNEADRWKAVSRKYESEAKANAAAVKRLAELEAAEKDAKAKAAEDAKSTEKRAAEAEAKAMRYEVAESMGVPKNLVEFLTGSSKKELEQQADALLASIELNPSSDEGESEEETEEQRAEAEAIAEANRRAAEAEAKAMRYEVAAEKGLPQELAKFLNATTKEDLAKQADVLLSMARPSDEDDVPTRRRLPQERLRSGAAPDVKPERSTADLAAAIRKKARGF